MSDFIKIKLFVDTGFVGGTHEYIHEVDREEWEEMNEKERDDFLEQGAKDFMSNCIDYGAYVIED
ncbi:DUF7167 family protein [Pseudomonas aeruginosa]|uniref:DUF7167 family protein n=1 Tax=Pseudomonas aeruginosa TaxID=287 RepID=UPI000EAD1202|nr:hypothetical protein [Pseudomonas aeruginosa]MBG5799759.1 hypothetical protein [Pseudomonas aeruginosa]MBP8321317.1 hypothetical protein [Pseudomonas aeruginosa]MBP8351298.1 hypothetical protein [Pseudomonas aeruginosa]RTU93133.1 hypothetical protein DY983_24695 [Pseudomonas aeruginosa]HBP5153034.1 hypothetical protein [Pseudomonas aeruginosa]